MTKPTISKFICYACCFLAYPGRSCNGKGSLDIFVMKVVEHQSRTILALSKGTCMAQFSIELGEDLIQLFFSVALCFSLNLPVEGIFAYLHMWHSFHKTQFILFVSFKTHQGSGPNPLVALNPQFGKHCP